jgi:ribosomal protein S18 acetylase RimI-like enzyme
MELRDFKGSDEAAIREALQNEGWTAAQIEGQIEAINELASADVGYVAVADDSGFAGFVSAEVHRWNRLAQIQGLAVVGERRRQGIAARMVEGAEGFARAAGARGIYVDTPANNDGAGSFYMAAGYVEAYRMPRYYADDLDGITYIKFFEK